MKRVVLLLIRLYQLYISPVLPSTCRFYPTCSQYCYDAISKYGAWKGVLMGLCRLIKCHPFHPGGYNPVK